MTLVDKLSKLLGKTVQIGTMDKDPDEGYSTMTIHEVGTDFIEVSEKITTDGKYILPISSIRGIFVPDKELPH
jgi:hypothetical protein